MLLDAALLSTQHSQGRIKGAILGMEQRSPLLLGVVAIEKGNQLYLLTPVDIEPATTECRAEILLLSYWFTLHSTDAKLTSHGKCAAN